VTGELPEIVDHWVTQSKLDEKVVGDICRMLLDYTGGHFYPFIKFAQHLFGLLELPSSSVDYLRSGAFTETPVFKEVTYRCFSTIGNDVINAAMKVYHGDRGLLVTEPLQQMAYWDSRTNWFLSNLLSSYLFGAAVPALVSDHEVPPLTIDRDDEWPKVAQKIIIAGLSAMRPEDFVEPRGAKYEDGLGCNWAIRVRQAFPSSLHMSPQHQAEPFRSGQKPTVDWYFNNRLQAVVKCVRNGVNLNQKFVRFQPGRDENAVRGTLHWERGKHEEWGRRFVVLNFQLEGKKPIMPSTQHDKELLFTFVQKTNSLYRGDTVIHINVVDSLPSPPTSLTGGRN
jgi:hypothetical protein